MKGRPDSPGNPGCARSCIALDGGRPEERAEVHLGSSLTEHRHDVGWVLGSRGKSRVLEIIHPDGKTSPYLLRAVAVGDNGQAMSVRLIDHGS